MIGEWIVRQIRKAEKRRSRNQPEPDGLVQPNIFAGTPSISVYRISNGFLLTSNSPGRYEHTMVYCKEVGEIGDQIVALNAREAMGVPSHVNITTHGGGGSGGSGIAKATLASYPVTNRP
jgi:hypothetical protein